MKYAHGAEQETLQPFVLLRGQEAGEAEVGTALGPRAPSGEGFIALAVFRTQTAWDNHPSSTSE